MTLCFADLSEKPVWTADQILQLTDYQLEAYKDIPRAALLFSRDWLRGQEVFHLQTSGSTGTPKPIAVSRRQMLASIRGTAAALQLQSGQTALVCLNPAYIAGMMMLARGWELGLQMQLVAPSSRPLQNFSSETGFDFVAMVPLQLQQSLANFPDRLILDRCHKLIIGGAALNADLEEAAQQSPAAIYATFGMTETVSHIALRRINGNSPETAYRLLPGIAAQVDERGCLMLKGEVTENRWVQTNDIVTFTAPEVFRFEGRADFVINSGGIKIFPEQLEEEIRRLQLPMLSGKRLMVGAIADEKLGQAVVLVIEGEKSSDATELLTILKQKMPRFQVPRYLAFLKQFPETPTGKIDRSKVNAHISNDDIFATSTSPNSSMTANFYKKLYKHIGVLLYAIAKADGQIHDKEVKAIHKIVVEDLAPLEESVDSFGTDAAFFAEFEFEILQDRDISAQKAFDRFVAFAKENDKNLSEELRGLIVKSVEKVAAAYRGTNKAEAAMIEALKKQLF